MNNRITKATALAQMNSYYMALVYVLKHPGAEAEVASRWAMIHVCEDDRAALRSTAARLLDEAVNRAAIMFPHLEPPKDTAGQGMKDAQAGVPTVAKPATLLPHCAAMVHDSPSRIHQSLMPKIELVFVASQVERFLTRVNPRY
jgi:hypothetical protein